MRAIDADALLDQYGLRDATKYGNKNAEQQHKSYGTLMMYEIADMIYDAPTIEPPANWTPCSIGMPTSGDEVDVTLEATDNWEACTAIGIYRNGQWIVPGMEDRKVIAWHERLEPYEEK